MLADSFPTLFGPAVSRLLTNFVCLAVRRHLTNFVSSRALADSFPRCFVSRVSRPLTNLVFLAVSRLLLNVVCLAVSRIYQLCFVVAGRSLLASIRFVSTRPLCLLLTREDRF